MRLHYISSGIFAGDDTQFDKSDADDQKYNIGSAVPQHARIDIAGCLAAN